MPGTIYRLTYYTHIHICCIWWGRIGMELATLVAHQLLRVTHTQACSCQQAVYMCREYRAINQSTIKSKQYLGIGNDGNMPSSGMGGKFPVNMVMAGSFPCWLSLPTDFSHTSCSQGSPQKQSFQHKLLGA